MLTSFQHHINFDLKSKIYLATSGGVDSMVLSNLLLTLNINHTLLHCNFNLRGQDSIDDEQFIIDYAKSNSINYKTISFDTKSESEKRKLNTQECARVLRYDWFNTFLKKDDHSILLTAHHLDDSIETFFINLLRGTGLKGLTGIQSGKNKIYRPLLHFTKPEIYRFAKENNITFREDVSNQSDDYLRNKLRHHFIPEFKKLTTNFNSKALTMLDELKATQHYLDQIVLDYQNTSFKNNELDITNINTLPTFLWHKLFSNFGISRKNKTEIINLINGETGRLFKTKTNILLKDRNRIICKSNQTKIDTTEQLDCYLITLQTKAITLNKNQIHFELIDALSPIKFDESIAFLDFDKLKFPLEIRHWQQGDKIQPLGMKNGSKLISDVLINKKINNFNKENQLVILSDNKVIWLVNIMVSEQFALSKNTKNIYKIIFLK